MTVYPMDVGSLLIKHTKHFTATVTYGTMFAIIDSHNFLHN